MTAKKIYFDNAATTPIDEQVIALMADVMRNKYGNPSSIHHFGRETRVLIEKARKQAAVFLSASAAELFFTSGGTEANNTVIYGAINDLNVKHIITSPIEHHAILHTVQWFEQRGKVQIHFVRVDNRGRIDYDHLEALCDRYNGALVSLMHANNEIANLLSIKEAVKISHKNACYFHSDMVQTMGHYPIDLTLLGVDFASCSAHKFHGPKGIGLLYINNERVQISPLLHGGAQERNMRGGTENVYAIAGLAKALELAHADMQRDTEKVTNLKKYTVECLTREFKGIEFLGDSAERGLYTILNIVMPDRVNIDPDMFLMNMDIEGIALSSGSACASGTNQRSHVLDALNLPNNRVSVRLSFSKYNTTDEIDHFITVLKKYIPQ